MESEVYRKIRERTLERRSQNCLAYDHLDDIASGVRQPTTAIPQGNLNYLSSHDKLIDYHHLFQKNMGTFYHHLSASIPLFVEEQCRIGVSLSKLAESLFTGEDEYFTFLETGVGDGANGRTMAEFSNGLIRTLSTSNSIYNKENFHRLCNHDYSRFHHGCFADITPEYLTSQPNLAFFEQGFNFIYENVTFPFYGTEREDVIDYLARLLKKEGLMIFLEKLKHSDETEYRRREKIKDEKFKKQYFSQGDVIDKRRGMLTVLERGQVDFETLTSAIKKHFKYVYFIWNSTNFYEFVASNHELTISKFLDLLPQAYLPSPFCTETTLPRKL